MCLLSQSRANAIDSLQKALRDVPDKSQLLPGLQRFVSFLVTLVADPNFKIAISSETRAMKSRQRTEATTQRTRKHLAGRSHVQHARQTSATQGQAAHRSCAHQQDWN